MGHYLVLLGFYGLDCARRAHENHLGLTVGGGGGGDFGRGMGRPRKKIRKFLIGPRLEPIGVEHSLQERLVDYLLFLFEKKSFCV